MMAVTSQPRKRFMSARNICICAISLFAAVPMGCYWLGTGPNTLTVFLTNKEPRSIRRTGLICRTLPDETGIQRGYVIFVPHGFAAGDKPPVLLFLNGFGENGEDGISINNNFGVQVWEKQEFFPFLSVAPQCRKGGSWTAGSADVEWAFKVLDTVIEEYGADKDRVYLTGVSSGGSGVWNLGSAYPDRFAALVPLCGVPEVHQNSIAKARLPVWNFYNDRDSVDLVDANRITRKKLIEAGSSPLVTEYDQIGHDCWNRAYRTTALYGWLLDQSRQQNAVAPFFEYMRGERLLAEWRQVGPGRWTLGKDGALVGNGHIQGKNGMLVSTSTSRVVEIHGDTWMRPASECRVALLNGQTAEPTERLTLSVAMPDFGSGGIVDSDGNWLTRLDPAAQRALRSEEWNDVRVHLADSRLTVRLNGWLAVDMRVRLKEEAPDWRCALVTPDDDSDVRWRLIRTRSNTTVQESK